MAGCARVEKKNHRRWSLYLHRQNFTIQLREQKGFKAGTRCVAGSPRAAGKGRLGGQEAITRAMYYNYFLQ
jgi:hypothetical protein